MGKKFIEKTLPLLYVLGAIILFIGLVRIIFIAAFKVFDLAEGGHAAQSTAKTLINLVFDGALVGLGILLYRWLVGRDFRAMGLAISRRALTLTIVCIATILTQYALIIAVTSAWGVSWSLAQFSAVSLLRAVLVMLGVGIGEEFFFRGFIFSALGRYGRIPAFLLGGLVFAVAHFAGEPFDILRLLGTFLPGLLFIYIYEQTGSLWPGAIIHAAMNLFSLLAIHGVSDVSVLAHWGGEELVDVVWTLSYTAVLVILAVLIKLMMAKTNRNQELIS